MKKHLFLLLALTLIHLAKAQQSLDSLRLVLPEQSSKEILSCDISSDGKMILTFGNDRSIKIFEGLSGMEIQKIDVKMPSNFAKFSPDKKFILTCSPDSWLSIFNIQNSELVWEKKLDCFVGNICFSNDGNSIFVNCEYELRIFNFLSGEIKQTISLDKNSYLSSEKNGVLSLIKNEDSLIQINNIEKEIFSKIKGDFKNCLNAFISPDENFLMTVDSFQIVRIFNLNTKKQTSTFKIHNRFRDAKFSSNEKILITVGCDSIACIYDIINGVLIRKIQFNQDCVSSFSISPDNNSIAFALFDSESWSAECWLYKIDSNELYECISSSRAELKFSPNGKFFVQGESIFDVKSGKKIRNFNVNDGVPISSVFFANEDSIVVCENYNYNFFTFNYYFPSSSNLFEGFYIPKSIDSFSIDSNYIIGISDLGEVYLSNKGLNNFIWIKKLHEITNGTEGEFCRAFFSSDFQYLISYGSDGKVFVLDAKNGNIVSELKGNVGRCLYAELSEDNKLVCTYDDLNTLRIYNTATGIILTEKAPVSNFDRIYVSSLVNKDSLAVTSWSNGLIEIWDVYSGDTKFLINSDIPANDVDLSKNIKYVIAHSDKQISLYTINGMLIYNRIQLENNNWLVKLPNSPYFMCSKDASKMLHYVTPSLKVIGFEQLDPVYNRPDIVLDSIGKHFGNEDRGMIDEYRKSWEKRIDRLGLDKEKLGKGEISVPNAEIVGADEIAYESNDGKLEINISANDPKYPLRRFNVYVNEVPLYGSAGISIAHLMKQVWDTTVSVPLSMGENKIQVSVMNELGLENFKYPTYVNFSPQNKLVAKTYFIGIGVNEFMEKEHNLKYCVKDVQDLAMAFEDGNSNVDTLLLTNKEVTRENILKLKEFLSKTSVNDKVIISCSSHGLLDDSLNFYLAMYDMDFKNPKSRGLKYEELESLLDGIPARQKLLLLDACNSGENDKTEVLKKELEQKQVKMNTDEVLAARGAIVKLEEENKSNFKKMNELFVNVRNNTGSVIISAAGGQESALEAIKVDGETIENGAFTFSVLEYLNSNKTNSEALTVNKLKQYAEKRVEEITNGKQKPTSRQETMEVDWGVR